MYKKGERERSPLVSTFRLTMLTARYLFCLRPKRRQGRAHPPRILISSVFCALGVALLPVGTIYPQFGRTDGPTYSALVPLATARCPAAGVALHAGAVAHQRVVTAFAAGFAFITLHLCFNTGVHRHRTTADCCA